MLWLWYLVLLGVLLAGWFINILGLPGIWFMIASCAVYGWWTGWQLIGLWTLAVMVLIGVIAEIVEFIAGAAGARKMGGSKRSTAGAIIGGVIGAIFLSIPVPVLGTILGACIGAFIGAWAAEYTVEGNLDRSTRVGIGAAKGKFWGILSKLIFSFIILVLAAWFGAPFPSRLPAPPLPVAPPPDAPITIEPVAATLCPMPDTSLLGVIFDMDGVLCDSEHFICEAACAMFKQRFGQVVRPEDFVPFVGAGENRYLGGVAEKYGLALDMPADKQLTYAIYLQIIKGRLTPLPGVGSFIARCRELGLKLAVASSADRIKVEGNLAEIGIGFETFDAVVTGSDVERKKPDPEVFLAAAAKMNLPAGRCLVVEDAPNGIQAAKAAGSRCLGLTTSFPEDVLRSAGADYTAPDLAHTPYDLLRTNP